MASMIGLNSTESGDLPHSFWLLSALQTCLRLTLNVFPKMASPDQGLGEFKQVKSRVHLTQMFVSPSSSQPNPKHLNSPSGLL